MDATTNSRGVNLKATYLPDMLVSDAGSRNAQRRDTYKYRSLCERGLSCVECASFLSPEQSDGQRLGLLMRRRRRMMELRGYFSESDSLCQLPAVRGRRA